jgi:hypothetical protein
LLPPCEVDPDDAEPRPLLELLLLELELLDELLELSESELVELAVVPVLPESDWQAFTTATDSPVPPMPMTAVATAAAEARRNQRRREEWGSWNASVVTMAVSLAGGPSAALQENVKRPSSSAESSLREPEVTHQPDGGGAVVLRTSRCGWTGSGSIDWPLIRARTTWTTRRPSSAKSCRMVVSGGT